MANGISSSRRVQGVPAGFGDPVQVTIADDGASPAYTDVTGAADGTVIGLLKGIFVQLAEINAKTPAI